MRKPKRNRLTTGLLIAVLSLVMVVPVAAFASNGKGDAQKSVTDAVNSASSGAAQNGTTARVQANVQARVETAVRNRDKRFDNAAAAIERNRVRLMAAVSKVEAAGGDCTHVRLLLQECTTTMTQARATEAKAARTLGAIPESANMRMQFQNGRDQARDAVSELKQARTYLHSAIDELHQVVNSL